MGSTFRFSMTRDSPNPQGKRLKEGGDPNMGLRRKLILVLFGSLVILALTAYAQGEGKATSKLAPAEIQKIAKEAYIFGYPLVLMDVTRQVATACPSPAAMCAPKPAPVAPTKEVHSFASSSASGGSRQSP